MLVSMSYIFFGSNPASADTVESEGSRWSSDEYCTVYMIYIHPWMLKKKCKTISCFNLFTNDTCNMRVTISRLVFSVFQRVDKRTSCFVQHWNDCYLHLKYLFILLSFYETKSIPKNALVQIESELWIAALNRDKRADISHFKFEWFSFFQSLILSVSHSINLDLCPLLR